MEIINTYIVCRITNTVFKTPKFMKVFEVEFTNKRVKFLDDDGLHPITEKEFETLTNNMKGLGL